MTFSINHLSQLTPGVLVGVVVYAVGILYVLCSAVRPAPGSNRLLRRLHYITVLCMTAFWARVLYDQIVDGLGGAVTGMAMLFVLFGAFLGYFGLVVRGAGKLWSRLVNGPKPQP